MDFVRGRVVRSLAGRDKGGFLAVVSAGADGVFVCDGKDRPLGRPKRKNPRHLAMTGTVLAEDRMDTDRKLRAALGEFRLEKDR